LAIPPDSIYSGQDRQAKAAVILKLREHRIPLAMRQAVQRLVASAVDKLDPQNVTVVDADTGDSIASASAQPSSEERNADELLAERLVRTLEPVVGPDHIRATVHAELDPGTMEESEESYDPDSSVTLTMQRSEETNGGTLAGGAAGTASNVPGGGTPAKPGENLAQSKSENGTYAVNRVTRHSTQPAGRLKRIAVAVLVDDIYNPANKSNPRQKRSAEELKSIEEIAKASVGFDATRGDIVSVQNIGFQSVPLDTPEAPTRWQKISTVVQQWSSYVRIASLLLLFGVTYLLVLRPVKKQLIRALNMPAGNRALPGVQHAASLPVSDGDGDSASKQATRLKNEIADRVKQEPLSASRLVQSWIRDGAH
jgi:flagellar M-ring protein FliF